MATLVKGTLTTQDEAMMLVMAHGCRVHWDEVTSSCFYCEEPGTGKYQEGPIQHNEDCLFKRLWELWYNMDDPNVLATFEAL